MNGYEKMREVLVFIRDKELSLLEGNVRHCIGLTVFGLEQTCKIIRGVIEEALAMPRRNCDVGTADEQEERYVRFCDSHMKNHGNCFGCAALKPRGRCEFTWAQMPYESEEKNGPQE